MNAISVDVRDNITFIVQKLITVTMLVFGAIRVIADPPSETSLAIAKVLVGGLMLAVAAVVEVMMWRSRGGARRRVEMGPDSEERLADRMHLLERALIERLPPTID